MVPNSDMTASLLSHYYPCIGKRMTTPVPPGVAPGPKRPDRAVPHDAGVIGFIGHEWKRKGLDIAVAAVAELRKKRPELELWVAGPEPDEVSHLFANWENGFRLLGQVDSSELYPQFDLLLHPARQEPYGMVIAEAMAARVPVVISDQCGIAPNISNGHGHIVDQADAIGSWVGACDEMLEVTEPATGYERNWQQVAREYEQLYISLGKEQLP